MELEDKKIIMGMAKVIEELKDRVETLEFLGDSDFMESLRDSEREVKERDFVNWDEL